MNGPNLWILIMLSVIVVWAVLLNAHKPSKPYQRVLNDRQARLSMYVVIAIGLVAFLTVIVFFP
jgi:hypothetical protein